ncbi:MAG: ribonuclease HIII [Planctomycetes bacterium]|jgi:ribonuclease HIII|nr:ribonuclease HIII [Planctomycetota bacterium]
MSGRPLVVTLDPTGEGRALFEALAGDPSFQPHRNPSALWAFRGAGVTVCLYASGKLVVQGAGAGPFAEERLGGSPPPALESLDEDLVGTDESGKGDYFGPLVVAAVHVPAGQDRVLAEIGVRDCKLVPDGEAHRLAKTIRAGYEHEIVSIGPPRYNEVYEGFRNVNRMLGWATATAIAGVLARRPCRRVLSDQFGNERLIADALVKKGVSVELTQRPRAESNPAVAAASLIARAAFLHELSRLSAETGMELPKGAGAPVDAAARKLYRAGGREALARVAKLHFRTTVKITGSLF